MVEVLRSNFNEMMPFIEKAIEECTFMAIDTEFTGLDLGSSENIRYKLFDTLPERYQKLKMRATKVIPCQIGLSMFTKCPYENSYSVETYTFYVCPRKIGSIDKTFMCQASSLEFLNNYGFDFNKFLSSGIPYLNEAEEMQVWQEINDESFSVSHIRMTDVEAIRNIDMEINKLLESSTKSNNKDAKTINSITLPIQKACHVYFQLNEIRRKYPSTWAYIKDNMIVVKVVSLEEKKKLMEQVYEEKEKFLKDYVGFARVFELVTDSRKPIVGHNFLMDLMLFFQHFYADLPDCYESFKKELHCQFPIVYDTKYIWLNLKSVCNVQNLPKISSLMDIYNAFESPVDELSTLYQPSIKASNCEKYFNRKYPHESGYDAFITGCVFLKICHLLATKRSETGDAVLMKFKSFDKYMWAVSPFGNKIFTPFFKTEYINIGGKDPEPKVPGNLFIVPKTNGSLNNTELSQLFENYSYVEWKLVNHKRAAIVVVGNISSYLGILQRFKDDPHYVVCKYHPVWHSRYIRPALWATAIASSCLLAVCISKFFSH